MKAAALTVFRIGVGLLFFEHGAQKLLGWMGGFGPGGGPAPLMSQFGVAGVLEFFGGLLLVLGLFTRPVAAILVVEMIAAFFIGHWPRGGWPVQNLGELALLYAVIFVYFAAHGAGPYSVDARIGASR
jgi:putative oxidoreductase